MDKIKLVKSVKENNLFGVMNDVQKIIDLIDDYWYKFSTGSGEVDRESFENIFKIYIQEYEIALKFSKKLEINNMLSYLDGYLMAYDNVFRTKLNLTTNVKNI